MTMIELSAAQDERARELHQTSLIIDVLSGYIVDPEPPPVDGKPYLDRLIESNYDVVNMTIAAHSDGFEQALKKMFSYFNLMQVASERTVHIKRVEDIERAHREQKVGILFGFQTPTPIGHDFYRWTIFHQLGLRTCQLSYMERNIMADGCFEPENRGLTYHGIQGVQEMNRLGIVVDLSHVGERSSLEAIELSDKPCIFSHSNAKAITPSARNITDEQIELVADKGGVVCLTPHSVMTYKELGEQPTLADYLDHFEYIAELVGTDHVGVGTDVFESYSKFSWETSTKLFYPMPWVYETMLSEGFTRIDQIRDVIRGLVARGFSDEEIRKILGKNLLRVFRAVWRDES